MIRADFSSHVCRARGAVSLRFGQKAVAFLRSVAILLQSGLIQLRRLAPPLLPSPTALATGRAVSFATGTLRRCVLGQDSSGTRLVDRGSRNDGRSAFLHTREVPKHWRLPDVSIPEPRLERRVPIGKQRKLSLHAWVSRGHGSSVTKHVSGVAWVLSSRNRAGRSNQPSENVRIGNSWLIIPLVGMVASGGAVEPRERAGPVKPTSAGILEAGRP